MPYAIYHIYLGCAWRKICACMQQHVRRYMNVPASPQSINNFTWSNKSQRQITTPHLFLYQANISPLNLLNRANYVLKVSLRSANILVTVQCHSPPPSYSSKSYIPQPNETEEAFSKEWRLILLPPKSISNPDQGAYDQTRRTKQVLKGNSMCWWGNQVMMTKEMKKPNIMDT